MTEDEQKAFESAWRQKTSGPDPQEVPVVQTMCQFFWAAACAYKEAEVVKVDEAAIRTAKAFLTWFADIDYEELYDHASQFARAIMTAVDPEWLKQRDTRVAEVEATPHITGASEKDGQDD